MLTLLDQRIGAQRFVVVASERSDGDVHPHNVDPTVLVARQRATTGQPWSMVDQCHGTAVHRLESSDAASTGMPASLTADVQRTDLSDRHVAMWAADCAVVFLAGESGRMVGVHAGWRGLASGALDVACSELAEPAVAAVLGPTIHSCCYEFGLEDLALVAAGVGADMRAITASTSDGRTALDVPRAVAAALGRRGIELDVVGPCTGCDDRWFSHRVRRDAERHATIGWMESAHEPHHDPGDDGR